MTWFSIDNDDTRDLGQLNRRPLLEGRAVRGFEGLDAGDNVIVTPLTFLGGAFYPINMLPPVWQNVALLNPMVYLISGFRWRF